MLHRALERQGVNHLRWGIACALLLAPFAAYAFMSSGWMTTRLGPLAELSWDLFCLALAFAGLAMRFYMAGHGQTAEAGELLSKGPLQTEGLYSVVRHPTVLANFLILLSGTFLFKSAYFTVLVVVVACLYYERLMLAKERVLLERHGEAFSEWAATTPLIVPRPSLWKRPASEFVTGDALRREAVTFAFIGLMFFCLEALEGTLIDGYPFWEWIQREPLWFGLFAASAAIFCMQLSRAWAIAALFFGLVLASTAYFNISLPSRVDENERALSMLKGGGYVLLLRHAPTGDSRDFETGLNVNDCTTQRNLSDKGREYAQALGRMLREKGVQLQRTVSSEFCRTRETARLMGLQDIEIMPHLNERKLHTTLIELLFGSSTGDESLLRPVRAMIADWKQQGTLLLVSHAPIINALTFTGLKMGEGLVLKPAPQLPMGFRIVGKIQRSVAQP
jgi:protein-S-isoprenylcysteine O-methyltransferase Ste14/phosphohistidine phosphatase SixA